MEKFSTKVVRALASQWLASTAALAAIAIAQPAWAQDAPPAAPAAVDSGADADQPIVVIGTRRTDRSATNSASPVDIIGAADLQAQPAANMLDSIKNIVPSFFVPQASISDASTFVRSPSLRGLPGDEVLVMINGKRFNRSALVQVYQGGDTALSFGAQASDISLIPAIAIGNLQILRDGATAQYGSDAIAGVMNFGLRQDEGIDLQGRYGAYDKGDGQTRQFAGYAGFKIGEGGFISIAGEYNDDAGTSRGNTRPSAAYIAQGCPGYTGLCPNPTQIPNYPGPSQIWGSSPTHGWKIIVNASLDVSANSKLYAFGNFAHTTANESFNYRSPITVPGGLPAITANGTIANQPSNRNGSYNPVYLTPCPTGNLTCPTGGFLSNGSTFSAATLYPAGFTPRFVGDVKQYYGTAGYKGKLDGGLTWDLSGTYSRNSLALSMYNSISPTFGPNTQTSFNFGKLIQKELDFNLDLTYPLEVGFASPITLSGGGEFRRETYESTAGDPQSYGVGPYATPQALYAETTPGSGIYAPAGSSIAQSPGASGYGGTSPQAAGSWSEKSYGAYVGAETDIIEAWTVGLAGRYEHYDSFGSAWVGKANTLFKVTPWFSIRGTVGKGFHAPSPGQSHTSILTTNFVNGNQVQTGTYPVDDPASLYFGSGPLKPEKSTNWGAGFVFHPVSALSVTADYYNIKVKNRIFISQSFPIGGGGITAADIAKQPALAAAGVGAVISYFTNALDTLTQGVDVVATYRMPVENGALNLTIAYNYNKSTVSRRTTAISDDQVLDIERLAPNHRATASANYAVGPFVLNLRENYYGSWLDAVDYNANQTFGAKFTTDFDVSYTFDEHLTLTLGGTNVFDTYPDRIKPILSAIYPSTNSTSDGQIYPRTGGPFGMNGGYWYARVRIKY